ncbi:MAG: hypothetical protein RRC34_01780 [Lentisphaeria bacterium]|nr:hypothetical protein [Lentisphaeria bacterium]
MVVIFLSILGVTVVIMLNKAGVFSNDDRRPGGGQENQPVKESPAETADTVPPASTPAEEPDASPMRPPGPGRDHLLPPLLRPATREIVFRGGCLDGLPADEEGGYKLSGHEYACLSDTTKDVFTLKVDSKTPYTYDLPQNLMSGQKIVVHLPASDDPHDLVFQALLPRDKYPRSIQVLFNGKQVLYRHKSKFTCDLRALLPAAWMEPYENTLTIMNMGKYPVVFDAWWVEEAAPLREKLWFGVENEVYFPDYACQMLRTRRPDTDARAKTSMPKTQRDPQLIPLHTRFKFAKTDQPMPDPIMREWKYQHSNFAPYDNQETHVWFFLYNCVSFFSHGGGELLLSHSTGADKFFCPVTRRPYPAANALRTLARLFPGADPRRLEVNVTSPEPNRGIGAAEWVGVRNSDYAASILVCSGGYYYDMGNTRITASLPWSGRTQVSVYREVLPEYLDLKIPRYRYCEGPYDRYADEFVQSIDLEPGPSGHGLFQMDVNFKGIVLLRFCQDGCQFPEDIGGDPHPKPITNPFGKIRDAIVTQADTAPFDQGSIMADPLPGMLPLSPALCSFYHLSVGAATPGQIGDCQHITPYCKNSLFITPEYTKETPLVGEGVALNPFLLGNMGTAMARNGNLCFWVYPHVDSKDGGGKPPPDDMRLLIHMEDTAYRATLRPNQWQRVVCPLRRAKDNNFSQAATLLVDRDWPAYRNGYKVTFEINSFRWLAHPSPKTFPHKMVINDKAGTIHVAMAGKPGSMAFFRPRFDTSVTIIKAEKLGPDGEPRPVEHTYIKESQVLDLRRLFYPEKMSAALLDKMPPEIRKACEENKMTALVLRVQYQK